MARGEFKTQKDRIISEIIDDLTHLEINTLLKNGMTAAEQPHSIQETLQKLKENYIIKLNVILKRNDINIEIELNECPTLSSFSAKLQEIAQHMKDEDIRMDEGDYILFLRMKSFCTFMNSKKDTIKVVYNDQSMPKTTIMDVDMDLYDNFDLDLSIRDKAKIKRLHDLGTEKVVLQSRISIDGDIITRIEESFSNKPMQNIINLHEKHIDISINYWSKLVKLAVDVVSGIFDKK